MLVGLGHTAVAEAAVEVADCLLSSELTPGALPFVL